MLESLGIRLGDILTMLAFLGGGLGFVYTMRGRIDALSAQVISMQAEIRKIVDILVVQGRHEERMNAMDDRILAQGQRVDVMSQRFNRLIDRQVGDT